MEQFLIDTNVVSDYLSGELPPKGMDLVDKIIDAGPKISVISQIELLCWQGGNEQSKTVRQFISDCEIFPISVDVVEKCVAVRKNRKVKTPDAIIAATASAYDLTLVTNNKKDFKNIKGVKVIDPHDDV
jgi:predicted nucleic acid-binding protein